MKSIIPIDDTTLERGVAYAKKYFKGTRIEDLANKYSKKSIEQKNDVNLAIDAFTKFCGSYMALRHTLNESGMFNESTEEVYTQNFLNIPSGFGASLTGLNYLNTHEPTLEESVSGKKYFGDFEFKSGGGNANNRIKSFFDEMINTYWNGVNKVQNGRDVLQLTKDFFAKLKEDSLKAKERYPSHSKIVNDYTIKVDGIMMEGFKEIPTHAAPKIIEITDDQPEINVVGNQSAKDTLDNSFTGLLKYNSQTKKNVVEERYGYPRTILLYGPPGTGKTTTIKSKLQQFGKKAEKYGKRLFYQDITNCFKSEYMNKSSNNLKEIFETAKKSDACYVFSCDDLDTIFFSRGELKNRPDEKANLEVLMHFLERSNLDEYKNFVFVGTTNHRELLDDAMLSRLGTQVLVEGPQTANDYSQLFQDKLKSGIDVGYVQVDDWEAVGQECTNFGLVGRDIAKICESIAGEKNKEGIPEEILGLSDKETIQLMDSQLCSNPIMDAYLMDKIVEKSQQKASSKEEKFANDVAGEVYRRKIETTAKKILANHYIKQISWMTLKMIKR